MNRVLTHQPDFETLVIAAKPDNDQAESEPVVLSAACVCGLSKSWEYCAFAYSCHGWTQTRRHLTFGQTTPNDKAGTISP